MQKFDKIKVFLQEAQYTIYKNEKFDYTYTIGCTCGGGLVVNYYSVSEY